MATTWRLDGLPRATSFDLGGPCGSAGTIAIQQPRYKAANSTPSFSCSSSPNNNETNTQYLAAAGATPRDTDPSMRTFSIHGPYGMNISLSTAIGGKLSVTFPNRENRASSEPPPSSSGPTTFPTVNRTYSDYINYSITLPVDDKTTCDPASARPPSPAPTEIEDPDPESILESLQTLNIKVRDYAYPASITNSSLAQPPTTSTLSNKQPPKAHTLPLTTEIFDQYKGIAEYEFRLAQVPRTIPIAGKTIRRLLDIGWITLDEAHARLHEIDWDALRVHDARGACDNKGKGKSVKGAGSGVYPWRPCKWSRIPNAQERQLLLAERGSYFLHYDRLRRQLDYAAAQDEKERVQAEEAKERMRKREEELGAGVMDISLDGVVGSQPASSMPLSRQGSSSPSRKRTFEASDLPSSSSSFASPSTNSTDADRKRQRLSGSPTPMPNTSTQSSSPRLQYMHASYPPAPPKQYPAPLSSYNPELYPDAASIIESQARPPLPTPPPRVGSPSQQSDTPPARSDTPPLEDDGNSSEGGGHGGQPLVRRAKGLKRTLSRTQTFKQL